MEKTSTIPQQAGGRETERVLAARERARRHYNTHREKKLAYARAYRETHKDQISRKDLAYRQAHVEERLAYGRAYREKHRERVQQQTREWKRKNKKHLSEVERQRRASDPQYRLRVNLRNRISGLLRGKRRAATSVELVGCSVEQLKQHLERQFRPGMSLENYGLWEVDHIVPCARFDLTCARQQHACFHFTNLQPLWASENARKRDRYVGRPPGS